MKKVMITVVLIFAPLAIAQTTSTLYTSGTSTINGGVDILGAHNNYGR